MTPAASSDATRTAPPGAPPVVDWDAAAQVAARLAPPGPVADRDELAALVEGLRTAAGDAVGHVLDVTRMVPVLGGTGPQLGSVYVVDRARWARANTEVMDAMTRGVVEELSPQGARALAAPAAALAGAVEVGGVLALLASRVLGQFDPYSPGARQGPGGGSGRLLLVAPNVLHAERELGLDPRDFRLWVCLHEQTHALQFAAAPWLAEHLAGRASDLLRGLTAGSRRFAEAGARERLATVGRAVLGAVRGDEGSVLDGVLDPAQRGELAEVTATMALLEGHADVMMDAVGPRTVPTVRTIRARFERRRDGEGRSLLDTVLRRLLGMDAKLAQYRDGAAFVRAVETQVGRDGLNAVWAGPENLPTAREIADARAWVRRVHG